MDLGFTAFDLNRTDAPHGWAGDCGVAPDWHELLPRLHAGWSARRELQHTVTKLIAGRGNFDPETANSLAEFKHPSPAVNPSALGNRKPDGGNGVCAAGYFQSGTRGLQ